MPAVAGRWALTALAAALPVLGSPAAAPAAPGWQPLQPVSQLDVQRYLGTWNQIAAIPQPFNLNCARDTRAEYQLRDPNNIRVENSCTTWTGTTNRIVGNARVTDPATRAQLHVSFPDVGFRNDLDGPPNYIVAYIAPDYSWALVGDPLRLSGFVLSRSTTVTPDRWAEVNRIATTLGYDTCLIATSPTAGGATDIRPLCALR